MRHTDSDSEISRILNLFDRKDQNDIKNMNESRLKIGDFLSCQL